MQKDRFIFEVKNLFINFVIIKIYKQQTALHNG
nr:MAG TPA: hypothetical protein [Caudoviricetes sp.]DAY17674.1 MAG TPA: hypothetical protein [Caudoviricetes sp.]